MVTTSPTHGPTPGSIWHGVAGVPITDDLLEWPPDLFAFTEIILKRSEAYRFALSSCAGMEWPHCRFPKWTDAIERTARDWSE